MGRFAWGSFLGFLALAASIAWLGRNLGDVEIQTGGGAPSNGLEVQGRAEVLAAPDRATMTVRVAERADSSQVAVEAVNRRISQVKTALAELGIGEENLSTLQANSNAEYSRNDGERNLLGYRATQSLEIDLEGEDFAELVDRAMDAVTAIEGVTLDGVNRDLSDENAAMLAAREEAFADARTKAEQLTELAGAKLGSVISIGENVVTQGGPWPMMNARAEMAVMDNASGADLSQREVPVEVTVFVRWEIQ